MRKHNVIVVGNGLFGSIAATLARAEGHTVTVVADGNPKAASLASGCILAPSWLNSMENSQVADAMAVLGSLYTVHDLEFKTNLLKKFRAKRVDLARVLVKPDVTGRVVGVKDGTVLLEDGTRLPKGKVLVAAGVWSPSLVPTPPMRPLWGASLRIKDQLREPSLHVYAPYRQAVAFNLDSKHVWMGDGTALVAATWEKEERERIAATIKRAHHLFKLRTEEYGQVKSQVGARPYVEGHKAGYFAQVDNNVWVSTGGAKNGTVLAAWQARRFVSGVLR